MNVDFPTPGAPEIPNRNEFPVRGSRASRTALARSRCRGCVDSNKVMAFASARRSPALICSTSPLSVSVNTDARDLLENVASTPGDRRSGPVDAFYPGRIQEVVILWRYHAADEHDDVAGALRA